MNVVPEKSGLFGILRPKVEKFDGFIARGGKLYEESRETFAEDPYRLIRAFHHAQVRQLNFSAELRDFVRRRLRLVDRTFQYARVARETFLAILSRKGEVGRILREMHDLGFLGRYIPEFGALTCLVQHEFYHRYTADEHTLVCIEKLDGVLFAEEENSGDIALFSKSSKIRQCSIWPCSCTTRERRPISAITKMPAPFSRKGRQALAAFPGASPHADYSCQFPL